MILALTLLLAACVGTGPSTTAAFRNASAPIWSAAAFQATGITGRWRQVAAYQQDGTPACRDGALEVRQTATGLAVEGRLCLNGSVTRVKGKATPSGPGRLSVKGQEDWWILWVDSGYRTLAIGTPSGRFGFVLDRGEAAPDRLAAAREVFAFNGYADAAFRPF